MVRIEPGSPWENGYNESFNGKLQDELLKRELFMTLKEAKVLAECWRYEYNHIRPHSSLGYRPPAPEAKMSEILTLQAVSYLGAGHGGLAQNPPYSLQDEPPLRKGDKRKKNGSSPFEKEPALVPLSHHEVSLPKGRLERDFGFIKPYPM